jgi:hypothetical protein
VLWNIAGQCIGFISPLAKADIVKKTNGNSKKSLTTLLGSGIGLGLFCAAMTMVGGCVIEEQGQPQNTVYVTQPQQPPPPPPDYSAPPPPEPVVEAYQPPPPEVYDQYQSDLSPYGQ